VATENDVNLCTFDGDFRRAQRRERGLGAQAVKLGRDGIRTWAGRAGRQDRRRHGRKQGG